MQQPSQSIPAQQPPGTPHPRFPHLFSPIQVGSLTLKNRVVNSPHATTLPHDGMYTERLIGYHRERARGGAALVCSQATTMFADFGDLRNVDDAIIPWYRRVVEAVHPYGTRYFVELSHPGRQDHYHGPHTEVVYAPSAVPGQAYGKSWKIPHELDTATIKTIIAAYAAAARRCQAGGVDGIELHFAHGNLPDQFFDPRINQRTDEWGGPVENRIRFAKEVIHAVREAVGREYVVGARFTGGDPDRQSSQLEMMEIASLLDELGLLDYFSVSMGHYSDIPHAAYNIPDASFPPGLWLKYGGAIKDVVRVPTFVVGRINHPQLAEEMIAGGDCDLVVMGRVLMADAYLPLKAFEGRVEEIRPCVGAQACWSRRDKGQSIRCIYNPLVGMEIEWDETPPPADASRTVVVVGGGLGGLEAARVAALRGHRVTLLERGRHLGGQIRLAAKAPERAELAAIVEWLARQIEQLGVEVRLETAATPELILGLHPDAVIVATGALPTPLDLPVEDGAQLVEAWDVLEERVRVGKRVVLYDQTGRRHGFTAADFLASRGHEVAFVTPLIYPGAEVDPIGFHRTTQRLVRHGVRFHPLHELVRIRGRQVTLRHVYAPTAEQTLDDVDTVVSCLLPRADDSLYRQLEGKVPRLHLVGDAVAPRVGDDASFEGHRAGLAV